MSNWSQTTILKVEMDIEDNESDSFASLPTTPPPPTALGRSKPPATDDAVPRVEEAGTVRHRRHRLPHSGHGAGRPHPCPPGPGARLCCLSAPSPLDGATLPEFQLLWNSLEGNACTPILLLEVKTSRCFRSWILE